MLPGTTVTMRDSAPPRSDPTDTGVWFIAGFTEKGPTTPQLIGSLDDLIGIYGDRVSYGLVYDAADVFFHEDGSELYVARVVGPAPVKATHTFQDSVPASSLIITAKTAGAWGNGLSVVITQPDGTHYVLAISLNGVLVETTDSFTTQQEAVDWSDTSKYVDITLGVGTAIPAAVSSTALASGDDDHTDATDTEWETAISQFTADLGPGQISMPGRTTTTAHANLLAHAAANNRVAILDGPDTATASTLTTLAATDQAVDGARFGGLFAPWAVVPGVAGGTVRTVPYSAVESGIMARNDSAAQSPNIAAAGPNFGKSQYALGLSQTYSKADLDSLSDGQVNVAIVKNGDILTYGYDSLVDPDTDPDWEQLSGARLNMAIVALANAIGDNYVFAQIDGGNFTIGDFRDDLVAEMTQFFNLHSLWGADAASAFNVDTDPPVNTAATAQAGELNAQITYKASPFSKYVQIFVTKRQLTEAI